MSSLIILGNGFDMHCGLKSSFKNYMGYGIGETNDVDDPKFIKNVHEYEEKHKNEIKKLIDKIQYIESEINKARVDINVLLADADYTDIIESIPSKKDGTLIESLLIMNNIDNLTNWDDVENTIKEFLDGDPEDLNRNIILNLKDLERYKKRIFIKVNDGYHGFEESASVIISSLFERQRQGTSKSMDLEYSFILMIAVKMGLNFNSKNFRFDFLKFFKEDLIRFETKFSDYIKNEEEKRWGDYTFGISSDNKSYNYKSFELLNDLIFDVKYYRSNILDFNYTYPNLHISSEHVIGIRHIHGSIKMENEEIYPNIYFSNDKFSKRSNENIIIGIDSVNLDNDDLYPFTKTYRVMENIHPITKAYGTIEDMDSNNFSYLHVLTKDIHNVIFYGHSLGEADYSYFQAIFDYLDIYSKQVVLTFAYSLYSGKTEDEIKEEQLKRIFNLINEYGETLDNKARGHNLLHKMLLENRIQLKKID